MMATTPSAAKRPSAKPGLPLSAPACPQADCPLRAMAIASAARIAANQFRKSASGRFLEQHAARSVNPSTNAA